MVERAQAAVHVLMDHTFERVGDGAICTRCEVRLSYTTDRDIEYLNSKGSCAGSPEEERLRWERILAKWK